MTTEITPLREETTADLLARFRQQWGKVKLDIGCGNQPRGEDYIRVDRYLDPAGAAAADIQADMWEIPVPDASVDDIWCSHALEHVPMRKVPEVLAEFLRILKPGGRAILSVPNFDYVARYWLTGADRTWAEHMVFGLQTHEGEYHKAAWTADILRADCEGAGFTVKRVEMRWTHNQETLMAVVTKP